MQTIGRMTRIVALASTAVLVGLAACSSTSAPGVSGSTGPTAAQSAAHFDSLYQQYLGGGTADDSDLADFVAEELELPPAFGATQKSFTVSTANGSQTWYGFTYLVALSTGDSSFFTITYDGLSLNNILIVEQYYPDGSAAEPSAALFRLAADSEYEDSVVTASATTTSLGASCSLESGLAADAYLADYVGSGTTCQFADFSVSASVTFFQDANLGALATWSISSVPFSGARFGVTGSRAQRPVIHPPMKLAATLGRLQSAHQLLHGGLRAR